MLPDGLVLPKIETFKKVGAIFRILDHDGGGELEREEFIRGFCSDKEVNEKIQELSPFKRYFENWDRNDSSLQNIVNALDNPPPDPDNDPVQKMLEMLTMRCRAVYNHFKEEPEEIELLSLEMQKPYIKKSVAEELLIEMGVRPDWADQEISQMEARSDGHLDGEQFLKVLLGTAEMHEAGFQALEARMNREKNEKRD